jgi:cell division protease FtsH
MPADDYSVSEATRRMIDEEQQELTDLAMRRAHRLIEQYRPALEEIAAELLAHEVLEREAIERIMASHHSGDGGELAQLPTGTESRIAAAERLEQ